MTMRFSVGQYALTPIDQAARDFIVGQRGNEVELEQLHDRDMIQHRRIFAQINELAKALGTDPELLRAELLFEVGHCHYLGQLFGKTLIAVHSMSRHSLRDHELAEVWSEAKDVIATKILPRIKNEAERERLARSLSLQAV